MVKYTLKEDPEVVIEVPGKDSAKSRDKAMDKLMKLLNEEKLSTNLEDGFGPDEFIEVRENTSSSSSPEEDEIVEAVQTLNNFATLKLKTQESKQEALEIRALVDLLFSDDLISEDDVTKLKDGFKVLKTFAQANIKYREAKSQAETARSTLDRALTPDASARSKEARKDS
jgi:stalled ribosome rescue protein Dom34